MNGKWKAATQILSKDSYDLHRLPNLWLADNDYNTIKGLTRWKSQQISYIHEHMTHPFMFIKAVQIYSEQIKENSRCISPLQQE